MNTHGEYIIASVRRLGFSAFRIILSALRILETGEIPTKLTCTDEDFTTALTICSTLMVHTGKVFNTRELEGLRRFVHIGSRHLWWVLFLIPRRVGWQRRKLLADDLEG